MSGKKSLQGRKARSAAYGALNGAYWMLYCVAVSYAGVYLLDRDYSSSQIGAIIAAGYVLGLLLQSAAAPLADRAGRAPVAVMSVEAAGIALTLLALMSSPEKGFFLTAIFTLLIALVVSIQPLVNAFTFYLERFGTEIPFGLCRGVGSASYAALSAVMGLLTVRVGILTIPAAGLMVAVLFLFLMILFCRAGIPPAPPQKPKWTEDDGEKRGLAAYARRYRSFLFLLGGMALIFFGHSFFLNFTIQIVNGVGGDSGDMGILNAYIAILELPGMWMFDRLHRKYSCTGMLKFAGIFFALKNTLIFTAGSMLGLYGATFFQALSYPLFIPASVRYVGEHMDLKDMNKSQSLLTAMITIGNICVSAVGGFLIDGAGLKIALAVAAACTIAGAAVLLLGMKKDRADTISN
ncbi:MAG: MFS transporter [Oscillospiraceae bacterium]|nr:MFS transporter [Oscillospiraceae bacterium]